MEFEITYPRKKKKTRQKKLLVLTIIFIILFIGGMKNILTIFHQKRQVSTLTRQIREIEEKNKALDKEKTALKNDSTRIEDLARQMGMMRQGEKKVKFVPKEEEK
ncbi:MAG: septum formation initiator family protein [bacterium]